MPAPQAPCLALLGAESTGKSTLAQALSAQLHAQGIVAQTVPEGLRLWCEQEGRTPRPEEQEAIAQAQSRAIAQARRTSGVQWVIADTTALMTAVYSDLLFGDRSLYPEALEALRNCTLIAVMALDLPWVADGIQRDGAHVREPVDACLRQALIQAGLPFHVIQGRGNDRSHQCLHLIQSHIERTDLATGLIQPSAAGSGGHPLRWHCPFCADPDSELQLFRQQRQSARKRTS